MLKFLSLPIHSMADPAAGAAGMDFPEQAAQGTQAAEAIRIIHRRIMAPEEILLMPSADLLRPAFVAARRRIRLPISAVAVEQAARMVRVVCSADVMIHLSPVVLAADRQAEKRPDFPMAVAAEHLRPMAAKAEA